jgi:hypothetical protein
MILVTYVPHTIDTSNIHLNEKLINLVDFLAKNTHENWSNERIKKGWRYGQKRNDIKKEHPCLVPYEELPESEKEHDRIVVKELLKTVVLLGFRIEKEKSMD